MSLELRYYQPYSNLTLDYHLTLEPCGITGIFGPSGAGKSTLLRFIAGLNRPDIGELCFDGEIWQQGRRWTPPHQRRVGMVFQQSGLFPHTRVLGNLKLAARKGSGRFAIDDLAERFGITELLSLPVQQLSGGQCQRVAIVRALLAEPRLLLLDEPISALDQPTRFKLLRELKKIAREQELMMLLVSHSSDEICQVCDEMVLIHDGRVVAQDSPESLFSRPDLFLARQREASSLLRLSYLGFCEQRQLGRFDLEGQELFLSGVHDYQCGDAIKVRLRSRDVVLATESLEGSSLFNGLAVTLCSCESIEGARVLVQLKVGEQRFLATLTHHSYQRLKLKAGQSVFAYFKAVNLLG
ncbi:molybdenum ABC transporter ATP-binding protein [Dongshaea marina]|uniref:molybdenum ABC transporter ATP-binding protein n=1 Tax=Dongshaea marina TaxID=2047966 RepID=UPI000D3EDA88|nr:molybdenum ABC transporter ATP-binding protein [Dongshaea marina]